MATPEYWPRLDRWVDENQSRAIDQLATLLRLPTVAHPTRENPALHDCAKFLVEMLTDIGAQDARIAGTNLHPIVLASIGNDPTKPTLLLYGHFDVVDPGPLELWETPPFEPSIRGGRLFARGSADNKGQFLSYLVALQALTECGVEIPVNIKFVFDGAEEIGSPSIDRLRAENPEAMMADLVFCADGPVHESGRPKIVLGSRGVVYLEIRVRTLRRASHSQYAAVLPNAAWRVVEILQSLKDAEGHIAVAGFYDEVVTPEPVDLELLGRIPCAREELTAEFDPSVPLPPCANGAFNYRLLMEPVINITGISTGDPAGYVTVVPDEAVITMDIGLVPN